MTKVTTAAGWVRTVPLDCPHYSEARELQVCYNCAAANLDAYARQQVREALEEAEKIARQHPQCHTEPRDEKTTGCAYAIGDVIAALRKKIA